MDIYSFIENKEIREHFKNHVDLSNPISQACIVAGSIRTIDEKSEALREILKNSKKEERQVMLGRRDGYVYYTQKAEECTEKIDPIEEAIRYLEIGKKEILNSKTNNLFALYLWKPLPVEEAGFSLTVLPEPHNYPSKVRYFNTFKSLKTYATRCGQPKTKRDGFLYYAGILDANLPEDEDERTLKEKMRFTLMVRNKKVEIMSVDYFNPTFWEQKGLPTDRDGWNSFERFFWLRDNITLPFKTGELVKVEMPGLIHPYYAVYQSEDSTNDILGIRISGKNTIAITSNTHPFYHSTSILSFNCIYRAIEKEIPDNQRELIEVSHYLQMKAIEDPKHASRRFFALFVGESKEDKKFIEDFNGK